MKPGVLIQLWRSPDVRDALGFELRRLVLFISIYVGTIVCFRYLTDRPIRDGLLSSLIGGVAIMLWWTIAVVRTVRRVLREHASLPP